MIYSEMDNINNIENRLAPILSKKDFIKVMKDIQAQRKIYNEVENALEKIIDGHFICGSDNKWLQALMKTLKVMFADEKYDTIEWWLYEDVEKVITVNGVEISVESLDDLYDYLIREQVVPRINASNNIVIGNKFVADLEYTLQERESGVTEEYLLSMIIKKAKETCGTDYITTKIHEGFYETADLSLYLITKSYDKAIEKEIQEFVDALELEYNLVIRIDYMTKTKYDKEIIPKDIYDISEIFKKE